MACPSCQVLQCSNPEDVQLYSLQSGLVFTNGALGFVMSCPENYTCYGTGYPITIVIPPGRIRLPIPPTRFPTEFAIVLSLRCCQSTLSRTIPVGTTQAQITAIANAMILECAAQQAACDVITTPPGPGLPPPVPPPNPPGGDVRINLRNSPQTASKACGAGMTGSISVTVGSGRFGAILWNPTAAQVATMQATLNSWALSTAQDQVNAITPPSITNASPLPSGAIGVAYSEDLDGSDGDPPYTFSIASGSLPPGLSMNSSTGLISGTPTTNGDFNFVATITDSDGHACSKEFDLTIGALCPIFITNITDGTMNQPALAVAAESLSKVLIVGRVGTLQIIETIAGVDTIVATNTYGSVFESFGVFEPNVQRFFITGDVLGANFILKINPTTGATEGSGCEDPQGAIGYNAARQTLFTMHDDGIDFGVAEVDPVSMNATVEYVSGGGDAFYFGVSNSIVVLNDPFSSNCSFINAGNYAFQGTVDITTELGVDGIDQFPSAGVECAGRFFVGIAVEENVPPLTRVETRLVVLAAGATFVTSVNLTPFVVSVNDDIEWMQANETLGVVILKIAGRIIVVDANTLAVVCSFDTTSTAGEIFCVQPANSRIYIPQSAATNVAIYGQ